MRGRVSRRRAATAGCSCRTGCGRRRRCRRASTGGQYLCRAAMRTGYAACSRRIGVLPAVGGDRRRGVRRVASADCRRDPARPPRPRGSRARIAIIASQKRSSSAFDSLSVGSTISVPGHREATSSARGSRSRSGAWRRRPPRCRSASFSGRRSRMHSCATRPPVPGVEHRVVRVEALRDVVGVEDRDLGRGRAGPRRPSCAMYIQEIGRMDALPYGAAETAPIGVGSRRQRTGARAGTARGARRRRSAPCRARRRRAECRRSCAG